MVTNDYIFITVKWCKISKELFDIRKAVTHNKIFHAVITLQSLNVREKHEHVCNMNEIETKYKETYKASGVTSHIVFSEIAFK